MKIIVSIVLALVLTSAADAQSWKSWWKHHAILCMCGNQPEHPGD